MDWRIGGLTRNYDRSMGRRGGIERQFFCGIIARQQTQFFSGIASAADRLTPSPFSFHRCASLMPVFSTTEASSAFFTELQNVRMLKFENGRTKEGRKKGRRVESSQSSNVEW
jgi:hypothetical protein